MRLVRRWIGLVLLFSFGLTSLAAAAQIEVDRTARDLLVDVTASDFADLAADRTLDVRHPTVVRVMRRLAQIDRGALPRLSETKGLPKLEDAQSAGRLVSITGTVIGLQKVVVPADSSRSSAELSFDLIQMALESGETCWIASCEIPKAWQANVPQENPRCSCSAFFLKWADEGGKTVALLATRRMAWHPTVVTDAVSAGRARLGQAGVDVGLIDLVEGRSGQNLDHDETLLLLQIIRLATPGLVNAPDAPALDIVKLLQEARGQEGDCLQMVGTVHRVTPVDVRENPYAQWLGIERYYQLDMFVSLGDRQLNILDKNKSSAIRYEQDFPATVVVAELPEGLEQGDQVGTLVSLPVFLFRLWSYPSIQTRRTDPNSRQVAPLLVGGRVELVRADNRPFSNAMAWIVLGGIGVFALFGLLVWQVNRRDQRRRRHSLPDTIEINPRD